MIYKLWQYHRVNAVGEQQIIAAARESAIEEHIHVIERAIEAIANGIPRINTIQDAAEYFSSREIGCVSRYEIVELGDNAIEEKDTSWDWWSERYQGEEK